jgi:predicted phosphodiesterase
LNALPERDFDELWCIGDLVDYGPKPREVVERVRQQAKITVRGNHDHAAGFSVDPQCSAPFKKLAEDTLRFTRAVCTQDDLAYLRSLPVRQELAKDSIRSYLVHAMPSDPLFGYCPEESDRWKQEVNGIKADVLVVGHTITIRETRRQYDDSQPRQSGAAEDRTSVGVLRRLGGRRDFTERVRIPSGDHDSGHPGNATGN